ncbi:MAG TPA: hypothetical protein VIP98_02285 [Microlunatus sp.]
MMMAFEPGNGQWVRIRTDADRRAFQAEKRMEQERADEARRREREFFGRLVARVRGWFDKPSQPPDK